jgi:hypothetical protein
MEARGVRALRGAASLVNGADEALINPADWLTRSMGRSGSLPEPNNRVTKKRPSHVLLFRKRRKPKRKALGVDAGGSSAEHSTATTAAL